MIGYSATPRAIVMTYYSENLENLLHRDEIELDSVNTFRVASDVGALSMGMSPCPSHECPAALSLVGRCPLPPPLSLPLALSLLFFPATHIIDGGQWPALWSPVNGMVFLHGEGIAHCDLKPGNVLLSVCTQTGRLSGVLTDFGVSRAVARETTLTIKTEIVGMSIKFASPEVRTRPHRRPRPHTPP